MLAKEIILASAVFLGVLVSGSRSEPRWSNPPPIVPDDKLQALITKVAESRDEKEFKERLEPLRNMEPAMRTNIVLQVILNASRRHDPAYWLPYLVVKELGISDQSFIRIMVPYASVDEGSLRKEIRNRLIAADQLRQGGPPDFSSYEVILQENMNDVPEGLVKYMYERNAQAALLSMSRVFGDKATETELVDKLKGDPKAALQSLADRPEWWAHLYAAETMKKQPQLRDTAILKKLEKDDNPLVKEMLDEIMSGK